MKAIVKAYLFLEKFIPGAIFVSIFFVMLMEIISRHAFNKSFEWNTEYCRYAMVWITFVGTVYMMRNNAHIAVTAVYDFFRRRHADGILLAMNLLRCGLSIFFFAIMARYGYVLAVRTARFSSAALGISQYWLYISTAICGLLCLIIELCRLVKLLRLGRNSGEDFYLPHTQEEAK